MTTKIKSICPMDILTYYHDDINNEDRAKKIIEAVNVRKTRLISLVVEEISPGNYLLLENFEYFSSLLKVQPNVRVPCLVHSATNELERLVHILKVTITLEKGTSWIFKNEHVMKLMDEHHITEKEIAELTDFKLSKIKSYILDRRIPIHIRVMAHQAEAKTVLEGIAKSTLIPEKLKTILYEKAILPKGNILRLDGNKFYLMKIFCSSVLLPTDLLSNSSLLEKLIDSLLSTNFGIYENMRGLLTDFIEEETVLY